MLLKYLVTQGQRRGLAARRVSTVALSCTVIAASILFFASSAPAELIASFQPQPIGSSIPDVDWTFGQQLISGPGASPKVSATLPETETFRSRSSCRRALQSRRGSWFPASTQELSTRGAVRPLSTTPRS